MCSEIELFREVFALNEAGDDLILYKHDGRSSAGAIKPCYNADGYRATRVHGKAKLVHRIIYALHTGTLPEMIDHINGVRDDNRIDNLRAATHSMNMQNMRPRKRNLPMGVRRGNKSPNYTAFLSVKGKPTYLGTYKTPEEAHQVYLYNKRLLHEGNTL